MSKTKLVQSFKQEIKCWHTLTPNEETIIKMFVACLSERMKGRDPSNLLIKKENK